MKTARYVEIVSPHVNETMIIGLTGLEVGLLHGITIMAETHPYSRTIVHGPTRELAAELRDLCRQQLVKWGFTPQEVADLESEWNELGGEANVVREL